MRTVHFVQGSGNRYAIALLVQPRKFVYVFGHSTEQAGGNGVSWLETLAGETAEPGTVRFVTTAQPRKGDGLSETEAIIVIVVVTVFGAPFAISLVIYCAYLMWWDPPTPWWTHRDLEAQQEWQSDPGSGNEQERNTSPSPRLTGLVRCRMLKGSRQQPYLLQEHRIRTAAFPRRCCRKRALMRVKQCAQHFRAQGSRLPCR
eukprot:2452078-Rhodomonas_salina.1